LWKLKHAAQYENEPLWFLWKLKRAENHKNLAYQAERLELPSIITDV